MKNKARIPYCLRRQAYRWTRNPDRLPQPAALTNCTSGRHVWVSKAEQPAPEARCLCGKHSFRESEK